MNLFVGYKGSLVLDQHKIPVYGESDDTAKKFSGRRIKRGLYKSKLGFLLNSDINGASNILVKPNDPFDFEILAKAARQNPKRVHIAQK